MSSERKAQSTHSQSRLIMATVYQYERVKDGSIFTTLLHTSLNGRTCISAQHEATLSISAAYDDYSYTSVAKPLPVKLLSLLLFIRLELREPSNHNFKEPHDIV